MKTPARISVIIFLFFIVIEGFAQKSKVVVSGSTDFSVKFIFGTCKGTFDAPKGIAIFNEKKPEASSFDLRIPAETFNTGNNKRDKDMKSEKYFYVSKYPDIRFKSSKVTKNGDKYQATGRMTIRDVFKTVTIPFEATKNEDGSYNLSSTFEINRIDYNVGQKDFKLKDIVTVTLKAVIK